MDTAESENGVQTTESKRIRKRSFDLCGARFVRHDIEVAGGIELEKICGRRDELRRGRRWPPLRLLLRERVTVHGFGGTDGKAVRVRPEDLAERARLCGIVRHRAGAVGINVCDLLAGKSGIVECVVHGAGSAFSEGIGEVMGVGRRAKAGNCSVNFSLRAHVHGPTFRARA